jgi:bacterioferritin-associated ferredoxin
LGGLGVRLLDSYTRRAHATMFICICNEITERDLEKDPGLISKIGTECGKCLSDGAEFDSTDIEIVIENAQISAKNQY